MSLPTKLIYKSWAGGTCLSNYKSLGCSQQLIAAQQVIIEVANAQMVVQNLAMGRVTLALHKKEKKKKSNCIILFPGGKGCRLTDPELIQKKCELEEERIQEETERKRWKMEKDNKKMGKEQLEVQC